MALEGNQLKGALYRALQHEGAELSKHYRDYKIPELQQAYDAMRDAGMVPADVEQHASHQAFQATARSTTQTPPAAAASGIKLPPLARRDPKEMAGQRLNQKEPDDPIRTDPDTGFVWFQEEVLKPSIPKPRARRKLTYLERGTKTVEVKNGDYTETFEVEGDSAVREAEVRITLPSYQVGLYKDPRFPFRIHTYNENQGFDLFEVERFYGGPELVPAEVKRKYVENVLCYDIATTVRAIQAEARRLQLQGGRTA